MALILSPNVKTEYQSSGSVDRYHEWKGLITPGTPYTTGGVAISANGFVALASDIYSFHPSISQNGLIDIALSNTYDKVLAFNALGNEIANGTDLSGPGFACHCTVIVR